MAIGSVQRVDLLAVASSAISLAMAVVYLLVIRAQGESSPALWVLAMLIAAAVLTGVAANPRTSRRAALLVAAGCLLVPLGILAILSIGLPILVAGALAILAASRARFGREGAGTGPFVP